MNPWSKYWQTPALHSCAAGVDAKDQLFVENIWIEFAAELTNESVVVDMATGNGAVPNALLTGNPTLRVKGFDASEINPGLLFEEYPLLAKVEFESGVDVANISEGLLPDASVDAVTSQFGVEYADLSGVVIQCKRILRTQGTIKWLMHHRDSSLLRSSQSIREELAFLLAKNGLMVAVLEWANGDIDDSALEAAGRWHLSNSPSRSDRISGQTFTAINQLMSMDKISVQNRSKLVSDMIQRMNSESERLNQLHAAALSEENTNSLWRQLDTNGFKDININPLYLETGDYLLGWEVNANKQ